jgi:hypothetical protein
LHVSRSTCAAAKLVEALSQADSSLKVERVTPSEDRIQPVLPSYRRAVS